MLIVLYMFQSCNDIIIDPGKEVFSRELQNMYTIDDLTDHFPQSWNEESLRTNQWSSRYCSSEDDSLFHNFSSLGVFVDNVDLSYIDSLEKIVKYEYKTKFDNTSVLKINFFYMEDEDSYKQDIYDTIKAPIYDFRNADFNLGKLPDSVFSKTPYGFYYLRNDKNILPSDLMVYVIDAKPGNFWKNKELAEEEPRPVLPEKWKHGYSRGIGISRSCSRVCWWVMAW